VDGVDVVNSGIMEVAPVHDVPVLRPVRVLLVAFGVLTALAVLALFVRPETTDRFFAWTIQPPLTAAFLGAAYAGGCALVVLSVRVTAWAHTRASIGTILVFTVLTLVATLASLDRFHFGVPAAFPRSAAWFWLTVYVVLPVVMAVLLVLQARAPGTHPSRLCPLPRWLVALLAFEGATMFGIGVVLYVWPGALAAWPWPLSALTSRAIGAWLISFGIAAGAALVGNDLGGLRAPAVAYLVFAVAEVVVVLRYRSSFAWDAGPAWLYFGFLVLVGITAAAGVRLSADAERSRPDAVAVPT
jgi:uncharacterized integral membrane protein